MNRARVLFIAPLGPKYPATIIPSLFEQTCDRWDLMIVCDGEDMHFKAWQDFQYPDDRIRIFTTDRATRDFGHSQRAFGLENAGDAEFIVFTGADNYYLPRFTEYLLAAFKPGAVAAYCDFVSRFGEDGLPPDHPGPRVASWRTVDAAPERGRIDCGAVMVRAEAARLVGWTGRDYSADWTFIEALIDRYGARAFVKVPQVLYVHN